MSWDCFSWFSFIYLHNVPYVTVLFVAVCSSLLGSSFCPCSGRRSLWRWSRRCRLQRRCSGRSSLSPASHGSCGLRSVPQRSGSARTCSSRSATPCTASWTWCALVSRGASVLSVCVCVWSFIPVIHHCVETKHLSTQNRHGYWPVQIRKWI